MKPRMVYLLGILALLTTPAPAQDILGDPVGVLPDTRGAVIALTGGTVHVGNGQVIEGGTVVIADGLIQAVGRDVDVPSGAWRIDAADLHIYPGLIDGLTEVGLKRPPSGGQQQRQAATQRFPGGGASRESNPEGPGVYAHVAAAHKLDSSDEQLAPWRSSGVLALHVAPDEGIFRGQTAVVSLGAESVADMVVATPVAMRMSLGGVRGSYPGSLMGVLAHIRQTLLDARHYQTAHQVYATNPSGLARPGYNRALAALQPVLAREMPLIVPAQREREIRRALEMGAEHSVEVIVAGGFEADQTLDELKSANVPVLVSLSFPEAPRSRHPEAEDTLRTLLYRENAPTIPAKLANASIPFAFYSDDLRNGGDFLAAVRKTIENGLEAEAALEAASLGAARILGVDQQLGSVEAGKIANLILAEGPLFEEGTHIPHVIVDGNKLDLPPAEERGPRGRGGRRNPSSPGHDEVDLPADPQEEMNR